ncbi:hypothetical protein D3C76_1357880 [compost metagenome]
MIDQQPQQKRDARQHRAQAQRRHQHHDPAETMHGSTLTRPGLLLGKHRHPLPWADVRIGGLEACEQVVDVIAHGSDHAFEIIMVEQPFGTPFDAGTRVLSG